MLNRKIMLIFNNQKSRVLNIFIRIFQDFSLFLILFLFYNIELLEICNLIKVEVNSLTFINNINQKTSQLMNSHKSHLISSFTCAFYSQQLSQVSYCSHELSACQHHVIIERCVLCISTICKAVSQFKHLIIAQDENFDEKTR